MQMDLNQLRELLGALDKTDISELILKSDDFELTVRKGIDFRNRELASTGVELITEPNAAPASGSGTVPAEAPSSAPARQPEPSDRVPTPPPSAVSPPGSDKWVEALSPMVGTFYEAPAPDEPPFVKVGDRVNKGDTLCIIEAMKLMNEIEAEVSGQIVEIVIKNASPVEFNQVLMRINPD
ncbi:MAG: acetyl-CoA carboxylase biotin carboxyl carrier protein [Oscillatoria sp. SIO1A7]|nr:acetyl-CoA carboxylase biotin carboxyl carrier protein [Oscillatoria sp. SIO1A7]